MNRRLACRFGQQIREAACCSRRPLASSNRYEKWVLRVDGLTGVVIDVAARVGFRKLNMSKVAKGRRVMGDVGTNLACK